MKEDAEKVYWTRSDELKLTKEEASKYNVGDRIDIREFLKEPCETGRLGFEAFMLSDDEERSWEECVAMATRGLEYSVVYDKLRLTLKIDHHFCGVMDRRDFVVENGKIKMRYNEYPIPRHTDMHEAYMINVRFTDVFLLDESSQRLLQSKTPKVRYELETEAGLSVYLDDLKIDFYFNKWEELSTVSVQNVEFEEIDGKLAIFVTLNGKLFFPQFDGYGDDIEY